LEYASLLVLAANFGMVLAFDAEMGGATVLGALMIVIDLVSVAVIVIYMLRARLRRVSGLLRRGIDWLQASQRVARIQTRVAKRHQHGGPDDVGASESEEEGPWRGDGGDDNARSPLIDTEQS